MIDLGRVTQGERGSLTVPWEFPVASPASLIGAAITAVARNRDTEVVTDITGAITPVTATTATWELSEGDSGTAGYYGIVFRAMIDGVVTYTLEASLVIEVNPAATAVQNPALVGVTVEQAVWLADLPVVAGYLMQRTAVPDGETVMIPDGYQMIVYGDFIVDGELVAIGDLVIL
ncbi:MAG: hypothetical protein IAE79_28280 [Anaerolinea sp.]|nr:hypothetical protein [Anaerolinea sp.]